jgi:transposase-like protein
MRFWLKGVWVDLACREIGISAPTYYKWRQRYDGMSIDDAKELKEIAKGKCSA